MCGLFGAVGKLLTPGEVNNVKILADLGKYRGSDSTGLAVVNRTKKGVRFQFGKQCIPSTFFMNTKSVADMLDVPAPVLLMGHCRAATVGSKTPQNAQPLHKGHILGVHNGTVGKYAPTNKDNHDKSDSHKIFEMVRDHGIEHSVDEIGHDGAFALVWLDTRAGTINFIRNDDRPLHCMWNREHTTMYWSSDPWHLDFMDREGVGAFGAVMEFDAHKLYSIEYKVDRNIAVVTKPCKTKKPEPKHQSWSQHLGNYFGDPTFHRDVWDDYGSSHCKDCKEEWLSCSCPPFEPDIVCKKCEKYEKFCSCEKEKPHVPKFLLADATKHEKKIVDSLVGRSKTAYCKKCKLRYIGECECPDGVLYYPPEFDLDNDGKWVYGHNELDIASGKSSLPRATSVPVISKSVDEVKNRYPGWCKETTYVGFRQQMIPPKEAGILLSNDGCTICTTLVPLEESAWWYSKYSYFCTGCKEKPEAHDVRGQRSLWKGRLIPGSEGNKHVS